MPESILQWKTRRRLLESRKKPQPDELAGAGRELVKEGRYAEAWEFFRRAGDMSAIEGIKDAAVSEGNYFLYSLAAGALGLAPDKDAEALRALAASAREKGLSAYEAKALGAIVGGAAAAQDGKGAPPGEAGTPSGGEGVSADAGDLSEDAGGMPPDAGGVPEEDAGGVPPDAGGVPSGPEAVPG
ncbi:MAG: hypothetical protein LBG06_11735 [Deltaproteobacteria bacterium]|jgi:hypothetical protein|nr:hypothetical protein [Deltaproteobacteria bacterium]